MGANAPMLVTLTTELTGNQEKGETNWTYLFESSKGNNEVASHVRYTGTTIPRSKPGEFCYELHLLVAGRRGGFLYESANLFRSGSSSMCSFFIKFFFQKNYCLLDYLSKIQRRFFQTSGCVSRSCVLPNQGSRAAAGKAQQQQLLRN